MVTTMENLVQKGKGVMTEPPYPITILGTAIAPASPVTYAQKVADAARREYRMSPADAGKLGEILGNKRGAYPFGDELTYKLINIADKSGYTTKIEDAYNISEKTGIPAVACTDFDSRDISIDPTIPRNEAEARAVLYHEIMGHALPRNADEKKAQALAAITAEEMGDVLALHYVNAHSKNLGYPELVRN
ncbi:MAG: hypothetical protein HY365_03130 [Candidatus Aenigmarchaeota archaeon]|nr:hypothetical protein [Candidatus Aenigmarchaeota archaeon]